MHIKVYNVQDGFGHYIIANIHIFAIFTFPWLQFVVASSQSPGPRSTHCAVIIKDYMFIFGGAVDNNFSYFSQVSLPFSSTSQWKSLTTEGAVQVSNPACVVTPDNKLLVIGGLAQTDSSSSAFTYLQAYDPDAQTWTRQRITDGPNPFSVQGHVAITIQMQKTIFVFGGNNGDQSTYLLQSTGQNSWKVTQIPQQQFSPPANLIHPAISTLGNKVYIIIPNGNIYAFEVISRSWFPETKPVQQVSANYTVVAANNGNKSIDVISPGSPYPVQSLSVAQNQPIQSPSVVGVSLINSSLPQPSRSSFPAPLSGYSAATLNQTVYIYGGITANNSKSDTIYQFNMLTNTWTIPAESPASTNSVNNNNNSNGSIMPNSNSNGSNPSYATGSSTSSKLPLIFGCVVGILAFTALVSLTVYWFRTKKSKKTQYLGNNDSRRISSVAIEGYTLDGIGRGKENTRDVAFVSKLMRRLSLLNKNVVNSGSSKEMLRSVGEEGSITSGHDGDDARGNGSESDPAVIGRTAGGIAEWGDAVGFDLDTFSTPGTTAVTILPKEL